MYGNIVLFCLHAVKCTWGNLWLRIDFVDEIFKKLSWTPLDVNEQDFETIEKFVCIAYDTQNKFCAKDINELRFMIFSQLSENNLRNLPPSRDSLRRHVLRSAHVIGLGLGRSIGTGCLEFHHQSNGVGTSSGDFVYWLVFNQARESRRLFIYHINLFDANVSRWT